MIKENREAAWNIASFQAMHVQTQIEKSTRQFLSGQIISQFWTLVSIRRLVNYDLSKEERKELDEMENYCCKLMKLKQSKEFGFNPQHRFVQMVKIYQERIMDLLKELGFFPNKEDRSKLTF